VVLQPLMAAGIFSFVFGKVLKAPSDGIPYFAFSFTGMLAYNVFSSTLTKSAACILLNAQLVSKVYFPRLILPLSTVASSLIDFAVGLALMVVLMVCYRIVPGWELLLLPVWLAMLIALAIGLGMYTSALMVRYRDLQYVFYLNPLTGLLEAFRRSLLGVGQVHLLALSYTTAFVIVWLVFGAFAFKRMERQFADVI
jgi:lipopolysaccharide transport system permease protein